MGFLNRGKKSPKEQQTSSKSNLATSSTTTPVVYALPAPKRRQLSKIMVTPPPQEKRHGEEPRSKNRLAGVRTLISSRKFGSARGRANTETSAIGSFDAMNEATGNTYIWTACKIGDLNYVNQMVQLCPDQLHLQLQGRTPLYHACHCGHVSIVKALLMAGCTDRDGTCYQSALTPEIRTLLRQYKMIDEQLNGKIGNTGQAPIQKEIASSIDSRSKSAVGGEEEKPVVKETNQDFPWVAFFSPTSKIEEIASTSMLSSDTNANYQNANAIKGSKDSVKEELIDSDSLESFFDSSFWLSPPPARSVVRSIDASFEDISLITDRTPSTIDADAFTQEAVSVLEKYEDDKTSSSLITDEPRQENSGLLPPVDLECSLAGPINAGGSQSQEYVLGDAARSLTSKSGTQAQASGRSYAFRRREIAGDSQTKQKSSLFSQLKSKIKTDKASLVGPIAWASAYPDDTLTPQENTAEMVGKKNQASGAPDSECDVASISERSVEVIALAATQLPSQEFSAMRMDIDSISDVAVSSASVKLNNANQSLKSDLTNEKKPVDHLASLDDIQSVSTFPLRSILKSKSTPSDMTQSDKSPIVSGSSKQALAATVCAKKVTSSPASSIASLPQHKRKPDYIMKTVFANQAMAKNVEETQLPCVPSPSRDQRKSDSTTVVANYAIAKHSDDPPSVALLSQHQQTPEYTLETRAKNVENTPFQSVAFLSQQERPPESTLDTLVADQDTAKHVEDSRLPSPELEHCSETTDVGTASAMNDISTTHDLVREASIGSVLASQMAVIGLGIREVSSDAERNESLPDADDCVEVTLETFDLMSDIETTTGDDDGSSSCRNSGTEPSSHYANTIEDTGISASFFTAMEAPPSPPTILRKNVQQSGLAWKSQKSSIQSVASSVSTVPSVDTQEFFYDNVKKFDKMDSDSESGSVSVSGSSTASFSESTEDSVEANAALSAHEETESSSSELDDDDDDIMDTNSVFDGDLTSIGTDPSDMSYATRHHMGLLKEETWCMFADHHCGKFIP